MKRFLMIDESGRGWTAEWTSREILDDVKAGGEFAEYNAEQTDENDVEPIAEWVARADVGAEYDLDAARLVCVADDGQDDERPAFSIVERPGRPGAVAVYDRDMNMVAELRRVAFGFDAPGGLYPRDNAAASRQWAALLAAIARQ